MRPYHYNRWLLMKQLPPVFCRLWTQMGVIFFVTLNESWAVVPKDEELREVLMGWGIWDDMIE